MKIQFQRAFKSYFLPPKTPEESRHFLEISMKCLNPQVRINKMVNKHTVDYHPSPSELTSRIHPVIFLWTLKGFIFRPECFLNFFSNRYFAPWQQQSFKFIVLRLMENAFVNQKVEFVHFCLFPQGKTLPQLLITTPGRRKLPISLKQRFLYFSSAESGEDYGAEKMTKIKVARLLVTSFDKFHHLCNHCIFDFCSVVP